jgi:polysaccharide pyruvyl transferase WcaK-like protein
VVYPSGWGNLGDEAIQEATYEAIRDRWPAAVIRAFTLCPAGTAARHRVEAEPLTGVSSSFFLIELGDGPLVLRAVRRLARRLSRVPVLGGLAARGASGFAALIFETRQLVRAWRWLRTADLLLAAGGGQLDDAWGGPWGQPYALARWAWLARRAGVPFAFLSVGFGSARGRSRRLLRYAVEQACYCSVRDAGSRDLARGIGITRPLPVVPDLAFRLRPGEAAARSRPGLDIGLSPMAFLRPGRWPTSDGETYRRLVATWAEVVRSLVARGNRVHLFVTDPADTVAVRDVLTRLDKPTKQSCRQISPESPAELLDFYRRLDLVLSSRLHGVLIAVAAGRPVVALSHERKVRALMSDAQESGLCLDLAAASAPQVLELVDRIAAGLEDCERRMAAHAELCREAVLRQEELLPSLLRNRP